MHIIFIFLINGLKTCQEVDEYDSFYKRNMADHGYSSIYVQRSGQKRDGCGIFYKNNWYAETTLYFSFQTIFLKIYARISKNILVYKLEFFVRTTVFKLNILLVLGCICIMFFECFSNEFCFYEVLFSQ